MKRPTPGYKQAFKILLDGGNIAHMGASGIRVRDINNDPRAKITQKTFEGLKDLINKNRSGEWVINKAAVRTRKGPKALSQKSWAKQYYKKFMANQRGIKQLDGIFKEASTKYNQTLTKLSDNVQT